MDNVIKKKAVHSELSERDYKFLKLYLAYSVANRGNSTVNKRVLKKVCNLEKEIDDDYKKTMQRYVKSLLR